MAFTLRCLNCFRLTWQADGICPTCQRGLKGGR